MAKIWGYTKMGAPVGMLDPDAQAKKIEERAKTFSEDNPGFEMAEIYCDNERREMPYTQRMVFKQLMGKISSGDVLIVCWMHRFNMDQFEAIETCRYFLRKGVRVIELYGALGTEMDLGTESGHNLFMMWTQFVVYSTDLKAMARRERRAVKKRLGINSRRPYGMKIVQMTSTEHIYQGEKRKRVSVKRNHLVWDEKQCHLIVELVTSRRNGLTLSAIARDWIKRKVLIRGKPLNPKIVSARVTLANMLKAGEREFKEHGHVGGVKVEDLPPFKVRMGIDNETAKRIYGNIVPAKGKHLYTNRAKRLAKDRARNARYKAKKRAEKDLPPPTT